MKQVDFDVRVFNLSPAGVEDGTQTRDFMLGFIRTNYPVSDGWKVESVLPSGVHGGAISVVVFLAKYVDDTVSVKAEKSK